MTAILEDAKELKIEKWGTLNTSASPARLPEGHSPNNQNVWMDEKPGSVVTANGYLKLGELPSGNPVTGLIYYFKSSTGTSQVICTDGQNVYWTTDYVNYTTIVTGLSAFFQLRGKVIRDKLWLTNGSDPVMTWDGANLITFDGGEAEPDVPKGKYIEYHDERVWIYGIDGDLSSLRFSALSDSSGTEITPDDASAWPVDNELQISEGDADIGTGLFLYRTTLYCSKQYSIWRLVGYDEYTYSKVKTRASTGTRFNESIQTKDNLVHFIGVDGLYVFDGEDAKRISDIIDPATSDEGVFAFRNLQQPLLNNQFWNVSETADFAAGTVPANLLADNEELKLIPADDSQADFTAGTLTDTTATDNPGNLQLSLVTAGSVGSLISTGKTATLTVDPGGSGIGVASYITDGNSSNYVGGRRGGANNQSVSWKVDLGAVYSVGRIVITSFYAEVSSINPPAFNAFVIEGSSDDSTWVTVASVSQPSSFTIAKSDSLFYASDPGSFPVTAVGPVSITTDFSTTAYRYWRFRHADGAGYNSVIKELGIYQAGYKASGTFVSKTLDYSVIPATYGALVAGITDNSEAYQFYTQSSNDGSNWDVAVNVTNGGSIGSTLKRYLRWGVTLHSSTGVSTPVIDKVFVGGTYLSEVHNTGGNIFAWSAFQAAFNKAGQTVTLYYRAAATSGAVSVASWTAILPGAVPGTAVGNSYIQVKIEFSTTDSTKQPLVQSFTVNWILDSGAGINTLQNVASIVILNRYWLAAATLGADANDVVIVLGKSTFGSPWHKKDFEFLSFCRIGDYYIAGSSVDGSIYRLEIGYSKNGESMDSFYETADLSVDGFIIKGRELLVSLDRSGEYDLSVGFSTDGGLTYTEKLIDLTRESGESLSVVKRLNINFMSSNVRFRFRINDVDKPFSVDDATCFYRPTLQRGDFAA